MTFEESIVLFPDADGAPVGTKSTGVLADTRVAFVGKLGGMNRQEARALVRHHGGTFVPQLDRSVQIVVIGADHLSTDELDDDFDDWLLKAKNRGEVEIIDETELWQRLGLVDGEEAANLYTPAMLARLLNVPLSSVRRWHRRGLIVPSRQVNKLPYFDFSEVASARRIAKLIASGHSPAAIESKLSRLAKLAPELERPLSQLSVIVDGKSVLFRQGEGLVEPSGQKHFDFEAAEAAAYIDVESQVLAIPDADQRSVSELNSPEQFIDLAVELEDNEEFTSAVEVYRSMALAFGPTPDASFRIAEILYQLGDLSAARERYYNAVELEPGFVEARASLGCVLVELGQAELAVSAFRGALEHHPDYPDVHFHLATLLDDMSRIAEAENHWNEFLRLAPKSPWADQARERLGLED